MSVSKNRSGSTEDVWGVQRYDETFFFIRGLVSLIKGCFFIFVSFDDHISIMFVTAPSDSFS